MYFFYHQVGRFFQGLVQAVKCIPCNDNNCYFLLQQRHLLLQSKYGDHVSFVISPHSSSNAIIECIIEDWSYCSPPYFSVITLICSQAQIEHTTTT